MFRLYDDAGRNKPINKLSSNELKQLNILHREMARTLPANILLEVIEKGEGAGPLVIVGRGFGKSKEFKRIMNNLDFSTHPRNQFPSGLRCFFHNKQLDRHSTASGSFQITFSNFEKYAEYFDLNDFTIESQKIIALELIRTGQTIEPGSYSGRGYVELMKGINVSKSKLKKAVHKSIRYGTDDWASSEYSRWKGKKAKYHVIADSIIKRAKNQN